MIPENDTNCIVVSTLVGVDAKNISEYFSAYPNPCENELTIVQSNNQVDKVSMRLMDVTGRVVMNDVYWSSKRTIDTTNLPSGFYTVMLERQGQIHSVKFVKK